MSAVQKLLVGQIAHQLEAFWCDVHGVWVSGWAQAHGTKIDSGFLQSDSACRYRRILPAIGREPTVSSNRWQLRSGVFRIPRLPAASSGHVEPGDPTSDDFDRPRGAGAIA